MELILNDTNIFDENIEMKIEKLIQSHIEIFNMEQNYRIDVMFNKNSISLFKSIEDDIIGKRKGSNKKLRTNRDLLGDQLHKILDVFEKNNIECNNASIAGINYENDKIKLSITEKFKKHEYEKNSKGRVRVISTTPDLDSTCKNISHVISKRLSEIFNPLSKIFDNDAGILCEIIECELTKDKNVIFKEFANQYFELAFGNEELAKKLDNKVSGAITKKCGSDFLSQNDEKIKDKSNKNK